MRLKKAIDTINEERPSQDRINIQKFKLFCATRWVEKITTLSDFNELYEAILECLDAIGVSEANWDRKTVTEAYGMTKRLWDSTFIVSFQTVNHLFGYVHGLSRKLQGTAMDVMQAYHLVNSVKDTIAASRNSESEFDRIFAMAESMAQVAGTAI